MSIRDEVFSGWPEISDWSFYVRDKFNIGCASTSLLTCINIHSLHMDLRASSSGEHLVAL